MHGASEKAVGPTPLAITLVRSNFDVFLKKIVFSGLGLSLFALGMQPVAKAQSVADVTFSVDPVQENAAEVESFGIESSAAEIGELQPAAFSSVEGEAENVEIAQARRRTRNAPSRQSNDFIGIGADFGYADDVSFAVISKLSINESVAVRPSALIGDDVSILVPVTYEFSQFSTDLNNFQVRPYAGLGAAYSDSDDGEDFNLLLAAGADVPLSAQFTLNAQANLGVLNDTDFGVSVGVGYNFGRIFR